MSRHWKQDSGDSYQGGWDYEGLQVDTRAQDSTDKHLDPVKVPPKPKKQRESHDIYLHEKEIRVDERPHDSPTSVESPMDSTLTSAMAGTTMVPETPSTPAKLKIMEDELPLPPEPKPRRICGMRKRNFWILFTILFALIVAAALIGGIVGGMKRSSSTTSAPESPAAPAAPTATVAPTVNGPLLQEDVVVDSPLNVISYVNLGNGVPASKQTFRMYFQTAYGNIKESVSDAFGPWQAASPIFTDAINNTGLATITYLNGTQPQATIFYVDVSQNLQEKRKMFSNREVWEQRNLKTQLQLQVRGNVSVPNNDDNDPVNGWDGYRIAAVHSTAFFHGPQARVFYRSEKLDNSGSSMIQELIWNQTSDNWSKGANFTTAWPTSHMAATIDESTNILRLFFSTGNRTLQEYWTDITTPETTYQEGLSLPSFLTHNNADISALSFNGTTYLYHVLPGTNNTLHETQLTGIPRSINNQETFNASSNTLVVKPSSVSTQGKAVYQPFVAAKTNVTGLPTSFFMFWADTLVGMNSSSKGLEGGYAQINSIQRNASELNWPAQAGGPVDQVPLGKNNAPPS